MSCNCPPDLWETLEDLKRRVGKLERAEMERTDKRLGPSPDDLSPYYDLALKRIMTQAKKKAT